MFIIYRSSLALVFTKFYINCENMLHCITVKYGFQLDLTPGLLAATIPV